MSAVIENTIEIARRPEAVFDYLADQGNEVHWNPESWPTPPMIRYSPTAPGGSPGVDR